MDDKKRFFLFAGLGCAAGIVVAILGAVALVFLPLQFSRTAVREVTRRPTWTPVPGALATQQIVPTFTPPAAAQPIDVQRRWLDAQPGARGECCLRNRFHAKQRGDAS